MNKQTIRSLLMVATVAGALGSTSALAQSAPAQTWQPSRHAEQDPTKRIPEAVPAAAQPAQSVASAPAPAPAPARRDDRNLGGIFLGVQGGKGWVYEGVDQTAASVNFGYRWKVGAVSLIGFELASGRLESARDDYFYYERVDHGSVGANARFNFGPRSPVFALVRAGYWTAEIEGGSGNIDGGYFGAGLGVDITRHVNLNLTYTNYVYFDDYQYNYGGGSVYDSINRADTLMLGVEARF